MRHNPESNLVHRLHICQHSSLRHNNVHDGNFAQPEEEKIKASYKLSSSIEPQLPSLLPEWSTKKQPTDSGFPRTRATALLASLRMSEVTTPSRGTLVCTLRVGIATNNVTRKNTSQLRFECRAAFLKARNLASQKSHVLAPMFLPSWLCGLKMVAMVAMAGGRERERSSTKSAGNSLADQKP